MVVIAPPSSGGLSGAGDHLDEAARFREASGQGRRLGAPEWLLRFTYYVE
jgi:hypothetical protein